MKERIQKILAAAGVASRRNIEEMILQGRISVNGATRTRLPILIDPQKDKVEVDGERIKLKEGETARRYYILMNKPKGAYSTNVAQGAQTRVIDLLPPGFPARMYPVGRLDAESRGVLLLTNDGELTNLLTHPRYGVPKTYKVQVDGFVDDKILDEFRDGVWLIDPQTGKGFKGGRANIKIVSRGSRNSVLEISLREGRNTQIRRTLAKLGHKVRDLTRTRMGPLTLEGLSPGQSRPLTPRELKELWKATKHPASPPPKSESRTPKPD